MAEKGPMTETWERSIVSPRLVAVTTPRATWPT